MMTKNFLRLQEAMDFAIKKNISLAELGRFSEVCRLQRVAQLRRDLPRVYVPSYGNTAMTKGAVGDLMCRTALLKKVRNLSSMTEVVPILHLSCITSTDKGCGLEGLGTRPAAMFVSPSIFVPCHIIPFPLCL